ncbi:hypothetical protein [Asticcacaulis solisilvae]|uniref:hypothetical protein n=1 Tax=Asticcacaulis solisilvae TaxID=1217274 RepID=UPI003FD7DC79
MKMNYEGWHRSHGVKHIGSKKLTPKNIKDCIDTIESRDGFRLKFNATVRAELTMRGEYAVTVEFDKDEIDLIFAAMNAGTPLSKVCCKLGSIFADADFQPANSD